MVDASLLAAALADDGEFGDRARGRLDGELAAAPELIYMETANVLRKGLLRGLLSKDRADVALADLLLLRLETVSHRELLPRVWELRHNVSTYDAAYVAVAEGRGLTLVTSDTRLAQADGPTCEIELLPVTPR